MIKDDFHVEDQPRFFMEDWGNNVIIEDLFSEHPSVCVEVPARFDFIGGWTDTPPYYFENGAGVLNTTLHFHENKGKIDIAGLKKAINIIISFSETFKVFENGIELKEIDNNLIVSSTLKYLDIDSPKITIRIDNTIPKGSGLGGSSLLASSILSAIWHYYKGDGFVSGRLRDMVNGILAVEQIMGSGGGWQDQIGGVFPGIKLIETRPDDPCSYKIKYLKSTISEKLGQRSLIIDTRVQRKAARILYSIRKKFLDGDKKTREMLKTIAFNAKTGFDLLDKGNIDSFAELLSDSWKMVNEIESGKIESLETIEKLCGNDLSGMKIGGAGGGGFILAVFKDEDKKRYYKERIKQEYNECKIYEPVFGISGMTLGTFTENNELRHVYNVPEIECL